MSAASHEAILGLLALVFLVSMGAMVFIGLWQLRDRAGKRTDST